VSVDPEIYLSLLERRLSLLQLLAQEFIVCRKEFVAFDLDGMYRRISAQEELCREIQRLEPAIQALQQTCAAQVIVENQGATDRVGSAEWAKRLEGVMRDLAIAQTEVGRLNQVHAAYLRRSRRTIDVFMNFIAGHAMNYARPAESIQPAPTLVEKG
jgi:hypothetical protein